MWYVLMFVAGVVAAFFGGAQQLPVVLGHIEPLITVALVASLLVPFAGFSMEEWWQKWAMQYCPVPLFGAYAVLVFRQPSIISTLLLVTIMLVHFAYWTSGLHSRNYRLKQFEIGFSEMLPWTARLVAILNCQGYSKVADQIIRDLMSEQEPNWHRIGEILLPRYRRALVEAKKEYHVLADEDRRPSVAAV